MSSKSSIKRDRKGRFISEGLICKTCGESRVRGYGNSKRLRCRSCEREATLKNNRKIRIEAMNIYGGKCACCGEDRIEFLCLDHINNDGAEERRKLPEKYRRGMKFYYYLKNQGWPNNGYQVLCSNCNTAFGSFGHCPHQEINDGRVIER